MKRLCSVIGVLALSACMNQKNYDVIYDDADKPHYTKKMVLDHRGEAYFPLKRQATGEKVFIFDPNENAWAAYDGQGNRIKTGSASGGLDTCPDNPSKSCRTVTGSFKVLDKRGPDCRSHEFPLSTHGGAKMPYCMHFHNGFAIHAAYDVPKHNTSHGCIRVLPDAAKWLNQDFMQIGTQIIVNPYNTPDDKPLGA